MFAESSIKICVAYSIHRLHGKTAWAQPNVTHGEGKWFVWGVRHIKIPVFCFNNKGVFFHKHFSVISRVTASAFFYLRCNIPLSIVQSKKTEGSQKLRHVGVFRLTSSACRVDCLLWIRTRFFFCDDIWLNAVNSGSVRSNRSVTSRHLTHFAGWTSCCEVGSITIHALALWQVGHRLRELGALSLRGSYRQQHQIVFSASRTSFRGKLYPMLVAS